MLVLSRQRDETIMIGDDIEITVVDIRGDKVRLGINAPARIAVHRKEVYEAIRSENQRASQINKSDLAGLRGPIAAAISPGPLRDRDRSRAGQLTTLTNSPKPAVPVLGRTGTDPIPLPPRAAEPPR
jgi:carbon storage regulator